MIDEQNEPIPDFALIGRDAYEKGEIPAPEAVLLLIEVSQASHNYDQTVKGPLYAQAGIPEYWLVDVVTQKLRVHTEPAEEGYRLCRVYGPTEIIAPTSFPECRFKVGELFKP